MRSPLSALLFSAVLLLAACDGPTGGTDASGPADPPETAAREITVGQTVNEALESATDVDAFAVTMRAGWAAVRLRGTAVNEGQGALEITVRDSVDGRMHARLRANGTEEAVQRFPLGAGRMIVQVKSAGGTGGYTFTLEEIGVGPEDVDSVIPRRQWVHDALAPYWDLDEFVFDGVEGEEISLWIEAAGGMHTLALFAPASYGGDSIAGTTTWSGGHVEPFTLPATGRYRLRVNTPDPLQARFASAYRLMVFPVDRAPEGVPAELRHATPVVEELDNPDDVDVYTFTAEEREMILFSTVLVREGQGHFRISDPVSGQTMMQAGLDAWNPVAGWPRWEAPRGGEFTLTALGGDLGYRLQMLRVDPRPETLATEIAIGRTVDGEAVDPAGDVDVFEFSGTAGTEVALLVSGPSVTTDIPRLWIDLLDPAGDTLLLRRYVAGGEMEANATERVALPADGVYRVRVWHEKVPYYATRGVDGPYRFRVEPVRYAPESVPAAITVGQTVTGESLEFRSDIDVFTFHAEAGERLTLSGERLAPHDNAFLLLSVYREGASPDAPIGYAWAAWPGSPGTLVIPQTGTYHLRVSSAGTTTTHPMYTDRYRGPYEFTLRRDD